jgi:hypothetical protein
MVKVEYSFKTFIIYFCSNECNLNVRLYRNVTNLIQKNEIHKAKHLLLRSYIPYTYISIWDIVDHIGFEPMTYGL